MTTLLALLCAENWWWDAHGESYIRFHEDGTGKLVARCEFCIFIAAEFNWKPHGPPSLPSQIDITDPWLPSARPCVLGQIDIDITLTTRRVQVEAVDMERCRVNECHLTEEAFLGTKVTLRVAKGSFMAVKDYPVVSELPYYCTYKYRLTCDPSPFPPRHMWKDPGGAPDQIRFWEWNQFQAHKRSVQWQSTRGGKWLNTCKRAIGWD